MRQVFSSHRLENVEGVARLLGEAGIDTPPQAPPRALVQRVAQSTLPPELRQQLTDWLLALERLRYAPATAGSAGLATLQREFQRMAWPRQR